MKPRPPDKYDGPHAVELEKWKIGKHNGLLLQPDGRLEHKPELEQWLRVVYRHDEEYAVAAGDAARLAKLLNRLEAENAKLRGALSVLGPEAYRDVGREAELEASERELQARIKELERWAAWAATFTCPKCGECSVGMVTTKKTCLHCDSLLARSKSPALQKAEAQLDAAAASIADWCRGHNAYGGDGPCDCSACRALANLPAAAREHLARDAEREQALAAAQAFVNAYRIKPAMERPPLELPDDA